MENNKRKLVLVTGLSGAGLSTTLKTLEDLGYKAVDNLPPALIPALLAHKDGRKQPIAIGIDSRTWGFAANSFAAQVKKLRQEKGLDVSLVFMDCQDYILQTRYTETRRVHPLAVDRPVMDGIIQERKILGKLKDIADLVLDTSDQKSQDLRRLVAGHFRLSVDHGLFVFVTSFGFKNGLPREADLVFDVRFLDNPHWDAVLRPLTGLDAPVAQKVRSDVGYPEFFMKLTDLMETLLPRYNQEGKSYLTLAIGCTGGKHRSVFVAEQLFAWLGKKGYICGVRHRDLEKAAEAHATDAEDKKRRKRSNP